MRTGVRVGPFFWVGRAGGNGCALTIVGVLALAGLGWLSSWLGAWVAWLAVGLVFVGVPVAMLIVGVRGLMARRR